MNAFHPNETALRRGERAAWGSRPVSRREFRASGWRQVQSGSLCGFFDLLLPSGLRINDCMLHQRDGSRWIGLPGKVQLEADGRARLDPATGKRAYLPVVEIPSKEVRDKFTAQALAALDRLLGT